MQQFTVPQFIDVEDKVIGPITTRQFIILMVGFILMVIFYKIFDFALFAFTAVITFAITGTLAFLKINGRPFHFFILNLIQTFKKPGLRVWNNNIGKEYLSETDATGLADLKMKQVVKAPQKYFTKSRLAQLSLIVDTSGSYKGERNPDIMDIKSF